MFRSRLDQIINMKHELVKLAQAVSWSFIETQCGAVYADGPGMPPLPTRLMAGLAILKHTFDLSDEELCARWVENPYFQFFCGEEFFLHELPFDRSSLTRRGFPAIVVEARHMPSSLNAQRNKTDRNDARGIAQMIRMGWFRAVHVKSPEAQRLRLLLANRRLLKRKLIDLENHIRGALRAFGLLVGPVARGSYEARVRELIGDADGALKTFIMTMLEVRQAVMSGYATLHKYLLDIVAMDPVCRRLMTVPGVGPITSLSFKAGIDDPLRFTSSRAVGAHFGLTPRKWQSGTIDIDGRITKQGDGDVRTVLCEAAACLLMRAKRWSALRA